MTTLVFALLFACPKRSDDGPTVSDWLSTADRAWEDRGTGGYEPVKAALDQAWGLDTADPGLRWRLVRLSVANGLVAPTPREATTEFATGRAQGLDGLGLPPSFQIPVSGVDAFERLNADQGPVAAWTALAWARWWMAFGPEAAALDAPRIEALADQAETLGADAGVLAWTRGLLAAGTGETEVGRRQLHAAIEDAPDDLWRRVDLVVYVAVPSGDTDEIARQREAIANSPSDSPEDRAARLATATW